jgi:tetratricopeptide (TPR) repeat protein
MDLATVHTSLLEFATADSLMTIVQRKDPDQGLVYGNLAIVYIWEGKRAALDSLLKAAVARQPNSPHVVEALGIGSYVLGDDPERALGLMDSIARVTRSAPVRLAEQRDAAVVLVVLGRLREAENLYRASDILGDSLRMGYSAVSDSLDFATYDAWYRNNPARAVARMDAIVAANPVTTLAPLDRPYANMAYDYALAGAVDRAKAMLKAIDDMHEPAYATVGINWSLIHYTQGEIALDEHRPQDALAAFHAAATLPDGGPVSPATSWGQASLGRAFDLAGEPDSAIAHYEAYLASRDPSRLYFDAMFRASSEKRLGELYEAKGDTAKAIAHLSAFEKLWKRADPELQPAVRDAQQRLARLQKPRGG